MIMPAVKQWIGVDEIDELVAHLGQGFLNFHFVFCRISFKKSTARFNGRKADIPDSMLHSATQTGRNNISEKMVVSN